MTGTSSSVTLDLPAGSAVGDVLVANITTQATPAVTPPTSAILIASNNTAAGNGRTLVYVSTLTSADVAAGSLTWAAVGANTHHTGTGVVRYGVSASGIIISAIAQNVGNTLTLGTIDVPTSGYEVAILIGARAQAGPVPDIVSYPTGYSLGQTARTNAAGAINTGSFIGRQNDPGAAGIYGGDTVTYAASCTSQGHVLALPPLVAPIKRPKVLVSGVARPAVVDGVLVGGALRPITVRGILVGGVLRPLP